jgi:hypothetical protein
MLCVTCDRCRLVWQEDREPAGEPIGPWAFQCPRCGSMGAADADVENLGEEVVF